MAKVIQPFARALILCDYIFGYEGSKTDIYGLFNAIRPAGPFLLPGGETNHGQESPP
jgi:hypothetical protein